jgi:hypothetical protein
MPSYGLIKTAKDVNAASLVNILFQKIDEGRQGLLTALI